MLEIKAGEVTVSNISWRNKIAYAQIIDIQEKR